MQVSYHKSMCAYHYNCEKYMKDPATLLVYISEWLFSLHKKNYNIFRTKLLKCPYFKIIVSNHAISFWKLKSGEKEYI